MKNLQVLSMLFLVISYSYLSADIIYVPADTSTIQGGIFLAGEGDTVLVDEGTYYENITFMGKAITVASNFILDDDTSHISNTIIDGSLSSNPDSASVVYFISGEDTTSILQGLTITGGKGTYNRYWRAQVGGGIYMLSGGQILNNNISDNLLEDSETSAAGGGIGVPTTNGDIIIKFNIVQNNRVIATAGGYGGIYIDLSVTSYQGKYLISNNVVRNNSAVCSARYKAVGGGIAIDLPLPTQSQVYITNNIVNNNELHCQSSMGAGIYVVYWAPSGTVVIDPNPTPYIANNIIYDNYSEDKGAGIGVWTVGYNKNLHNISPQPLIINNTLHNNKSSDGCALFNFDCFPLLINNILWDDLSIENSREIFSDNIDYRPDYNKLINDGEVYIHYSDIQGGWNGIGNINVDPNFVDTLFNISDSSYCIGAGISDFTLDEYQYIAPNIDFAGNNRPNPPGSRPDMGALENERAFPDLENILEVPDEYSTIQAAINAANEGDTVLVAEDTYYENINFIGKAITVASHFLIDGDTSHISNTIIDGSQPQNPDSGSVVYFISGEDFNSILCGFTITGGTGTKAWYAALGTYFIWGGGINIEGSSATICHNIVRDNEVSSSSFATYAAGINALFEGILRINNNIIRNNVQISGDPNYGAGCGGIWAEGNGECFIEHNVVDGNSALVTSDENASGGGISIYARYTSGTYYIRNNIVSNNSVTAESDYKALGGGIDCEFNLPTGNNRVYISENKIYGNELHCKASMGAGIYVVYWSSYGTIVNDPNPTPYIANNLIYDNYSQDKGAGIGVWTVGLNTQSNITPQPQIINNTFYNNKSTDGCALFNFDCFPLLMNNILWDDLSVENSREVFNDDIDYRPDYNKITNDGEVYIYFSDIQGGFEGSGNIDTNPAFADSLFNLSDTSYCVGNGTDSIQVDEYWYTCPGTDYFGKPRPNAAIDGFVDMGAIESPFSRVPMGIIESDVLQPLKFNLSQNYPNPFNPVTTISFTIPKSEYTTLRVYNILGKEVATLVSRKLNQGIHTYLFDGSHLASGIYYCQLVAGDYREVKKMVLIK